MVAVAGGIGSVLRYALHLGMAALAGPDWPWGTFLVNVIGSFALGAVFELGAGKTLLGVDARLVLGTGLLGGFTTYSTFNLEALRLWSTAPGKAAAYVAATVVTCLVAGAAGMLLARAIRR